MIAISLSPWHGPSLPTVTAGAYHYALEVSGSPAQRVRLNVQGVPAGWIAAFCTATVCSPMQVRFALSAHGRRRFEFGLIHESGSLSPKMRITIRSSDGASRTLLIPSKPPVTP